MIHGDGCQEGLVMYSVIIYDGLQLEGYTNFFCQKKDSMKKKLRFLK